MNHTIRLGIALAIGVAAGAVNWLYIKSQVTPAVFVGVRIKEDVDQGDTIEKDQLEEFEMIVPRGVEASEFGTQFYEWKNVDLIVGTPASEALREGDLLLTKESIDTSVNSELRMLGPFRLLSVDEIRAGDPEGLLANTNGDAITIAVDPTSQDAQRLFDILDASKDERNDGALFGPSLRISHIVLLPSANGESASTSDSNESTEALIEGGVPRPKPIALRENEVAAFVPLDGVTVVPGVLVEGNQISFVLR